MRFVFSTQELSLVEGTNLAAQFAEIYEIFSIKGMNEHNYFAKLRKLLLGAK